ncbi:MAG: hypothetical protein IPN05_19935 [Sulfuritalea sp.]|nr:hypothetical protein [Sulfuritalea sp.]
MYLGQQHGEPQHHPAPAAATSRVRVASTVAATTSISDTTATPPTVSLTASLSIAEGGITHTASLGAAAQGQVLVTITGGSIITIASGATSGTVKVPPRPARTCIWTAAR